MPAFKDMTGHVNGVLRVVRHAGWYAQRNGTTGSLWECECAADLGGCGKLTTVRVGHLRRNTSCGCIGRENARRAAITHGLTLGHGWPAEYGVWMGVRRRTTNPRDPKWPLYGGRGIALCARWNDAALFIQDMGARPSPAHSIDRVDNDGGYWCGHADCADCGPAGRAPNCRWATQVEQQRNRRDNRMITANGHARCLAEWAELLGVSTACIQRRLKAGVQMERAVTTKSFRRGQGVRMPTC